MALKKTSYARSKDLPTDAVARLFDAAQKKTNQEAATLLIQVLAEISDAIAAGTVTHLTWGKPRDGKAFLVTVNYADGNRQYIGGADFYALVDQLADELIETAGGEQG